MINSSSAPWYTRHGLSMLLKASTLLVTVAVVVWIGLAIALTSGWQAPAAELAAKATPWPAASYGWQPISYANYLHTRRAVDHYTKYLEAQKATATSATNTITGETLTKLLRDQATFDLATEHGVHMSTADLDQAFTAEILQGGNSQETTKAINQLYGWTPTEFKNRILRVVLMRAKLQEALAADTKLNGASKAQAEKVLALVQAGTQSFEDIAKAYSDDSYGAGGGDLGFFGRGQQVKEIDDAAFSLAVGQTSDLIHSQYGWHVIKVTDKKTDQGQEQVRAEEIFVAGPSVDDLITKQLRSHRVLIFVPGWHWDATSGQVTKNTARKV